MLKVMAFMAGLMPEEELINELIESLVYYRSDPSEENKQKVRINTTMLIMKLEHGDDPFKMIQNIDEVEKIRDLQNLTKKFPKQ